MLLFRQLILQGQKLLSMLMLVISVTAQIGVLLFKLFSKPVSLGLQDALGTALCYMVF